MIRKVYKKTLAIVALFTLEFITTWVLFIGSLALFGFIANVLLYNKQEKFDLVSYQWVRSFTTPFVTDLMKSMSFLGSREFVPVLFMAVLIYFIFIKKQRWYSLKIPVVAIGSLLLNLYLKYLFGRPRPTGYRLVEVTGLSFPSGHAMTAFSFYGLLIYFVWKEIPHHFLKYVVCIFLLIIIHLIGISRIYLGVHYASDVVAGFAIGYSWLIFSILILKKIEKFYQRKVDPTKEFQSEV